MKPLPASSIDRGPPPRPPYTNTNMGFIEDQLFHVMGPVAPIEQGFVDPGIRIRIRIR